MTEYYQINGVNFTLGATFPSSSGIGQQINYFFDNLLPGATHYFAAVSNNESGGFSGYNGLVSFYVPELPEHIPVAFSWYVSSLDPHSKYTANAYRPLGNIFPNPNPQPPLPPIEDYPPGNCAAAWFAGNTTWVLSGKKAVIPIFTFNSFFAPGVMAPQPNAYGVSYQNAFHPDDMCKDAFGNFVEQEFFNIPTNNDPTFQNTPAYKGVQKFASPWMEGAANRLYTLWGEWLDQAEAAGITFQYFMGNIADTTTPSPMNYFSNTTRREGNYGAGYTSHHNIIFNDPRFDSLTAGNAEIYGSLRTQLLLDQGYTLTDFTVLDLEGPTGGYKLLNFVMGRLGAYYMNEGFYKPVQERYPNAQLSNYGSYKILKEDKVSDYNGHKQYFDVKIGNARSPICYLEMFGAGSLYRIDPDDPTSLRYVDPPIPPEQRYGFDSTGNISFWKAFLLDQQKLRALIRNMEPGEMFHPWFKVQGDDFFYLNYEYILAKYWKENIYHTCLNNPEALFMFATVPQKLINVIKEISDLKNERRAFVLSQNKQKINFHTHYLISGCRINTGECLWRVTINYDTVNYLIINDVTYDVRFIPHVENEEEKIYIPAQGIPGIWFNSGTNASSFEFISYNAAQKTLTLRKSI